MYDFLKNEANKNGWDFMYARRDFQNLYNKVDNNQVVLLLDPITIKYNHNDMNVVESVNHSSSFLLVTSSDFDELSYEDRYIKYIKPRLQNAYNSINQSLRCEHDVDFELWEIKEVINILDYNLDGILVNFNIKWNGRY